MLKEDLMASGLSLPRWGSNALAYCRKTGALGLTSVCKASKRTRAIMVTKELISNWCRHANGGM